MALLTSLNSALTGLRAAMTALQTTGHNVSNAATPGYSRQRVELVAQRPLDSTRFQIGSGVAVQRIARIIDQSLELALRGAAASLSDLGARAETLQRLEGLIGALSGSDIGARIDRLFDAVQEFAARPEDVSTRSQVLAAADGLARTLNQTALRIRETRAQLNGEVRTTVAEINRIADGIAELNAQIVSSENAGASPGTANDLRDRRDLLLRQLSDLIAVSAVETSTGEVNVLAGSAFLVFAGRANDLSTTDAVDRGVLVSTPVFADGSLPFTVTEGRLRGLIESRDGILGGAQASLDVLANALAFEFNRVQSTGQGLERFTDLTGLHAMPGSAVAVAVEGRVTLSSASTNTITDSSLVGLANPTGRMVQILSGANTLETRRIASFDAATGTIFLDRPLAQPAAAGDRIQIKEYPFPVVNGSFQLVITNELTGTQQAFTINVDLDKVAPADTTLAGIVAQINAVTPLVADVTASLTPDGRLRLQSTSPTVRFNFANDTSGFLAAAGMNAFFAGSLASDISVNPTLAQNPRLLSGARSNAPGDNTNALAFAALRDLAVMGGTSTFEDFYQTFVGGVGVRASDAKNRFETQALLAGQLENQRERISGVNLDEEAVNMIQFQRMFQASARFVSVIDDLLDTLINGI